MLTSWLTRLIRRNEHWITEAVERGMSAYARESRGKRRPDSPSAEPSTERGFGGVEIERSFSIP